MNYKIPAWASAVALALIGCSFAPRARAADTDREGAKAAVKQFYTALNVMFTGDAQPMLDLWSHADDVTYMGPTGGFKTGWSEIRKGWEAQAAMHMGGKVEPSDMHLTVGGDIAVASNYEKGEITANGQIQKISIRATSLFRKEDGQWKMIGHHTDLLPFLDK